MMKSSLRVAFCGIIAALSIVVLFLTNIFPTATLALPALAGVLLMVVVIEVAIRWAWAVFAVCSVLSFFLLADKQAFLCYVLFFGYYPVLKAVIEKYVKKRWISWVLKLLVLNIAVFIDAFLTIWILNFPIESLMIFGLYTPFILVLAVNIVFLVYDSALSGLVFIYWQRIHPSISRLHISEKNK